MSDSIELVIKAANGSVADFKISAQANWTVTQVKNHIYRHYPTHPPLSSQRLIYSGRMLLDQQTLLEALPDLTSLIQPVIIHLVAYERSASAPVISQSSPSSTSSRTPSTTGSRSQHSDSGSGRGRGNLSPVQEAADGARAGGSEGERGGVAPPINDGRPQYQQQGMPVQGQQQHPWLRHRGVGGGVAAAGVGGAYQFQQPNAPGHLFMPMAAGFPPQMGGAFQPQMAPGGGFPGQFPNFYHPFGAPYPNQHMAQYWGYYNQPNREPAATTGEGMAREGGEVVEDLDLQNLQDLANNPDVDDQDVPMNAGGLGMMAGGGGAAQLRRHRDVVDYLYMLTMLSFLALIAYVTGSLGRLMVFAGGIVFMMLNQRGWFSLRRRRQARQRDEVNPLERVGQQQQEQNGEERREEEEREGGEENIEREEAQRERVETDGGEMEPSSHTSSNQEQPRNEEETRREDEQEGEQLERGGNNGAITERPGVPSPQPARPVAEEQPARPGVLSTILVFITSFFTSLVPQQRPELQFN